MPDVEMEYAIRLLAYELWDKADRPNGKHLDFWKQAERQIGENAAADERLEEGLEESFPASDTPADVMRAEKL